MSDELTLEQLAGIEMGEEAEKKSAQSVQLPVGNYNSVPELTLRVFKSSEQAKYPGRAMAKFFGKFEGTGEVTGKSGFAGFMVSWEPRYKDDGKADLSTRLYSNLLATYRQAMGMARGARIENEVQTVLSYASKYSVGVRFGQGDEDNIAFSISTAKQ